MNNPNLIRQLIKPKKEWKKDNEVTHCFACHKQFLPIVRWRHHCRFCGNIFCSKCSENIIYGDQIDYKEEKRLRHCEKCHERIKKVITEEFNEYKHKSELYDVSENEFKFDIEDTTEVTSSVNLGIQDEDVLKYKIRVEKISRSFEEEIANVTRALCERYALDVSTWGKRLVELTTKTVGEAYIDTFVRFNYFNLLREIRVITIVTPKDCVTAVCVKGLILERNIPSKQLETHLKFPNILIFKPAIEAQSLMQTGQTRFDMMIKNENSILKNYLQKIYRLKPNVIFVAEHVSKVAFEEFLENGIMVISKVKMEDLRIIERLSLIKKMVDHLHLIDKYRPSDVLGVCEKIYFKTIKQGEMLMFIEQDSGIRSVLIGDWSEDINARLKSCFSLLLKIGWTLKKVREMVFKDLKFLGGELHPPSLVLLEEIDWQRYHGEKLASALEVQGTKIIYKCRRVEELPKAQENYCARHGHWSFLEFCGFPKTFKAHYYQGQDLLLGTYLLKCIANSSKVCKRCQTFHVERYFIDNYHVTIRHEIYYDRLTSKINPKNQDSEQEEEVLSQELKKEQSVLIYESIVDYFQKTKEKMFFILFFKCENCGEMMNNTKVRLGKEYLSINFLHYLSELVYLYKKKGQSSPSYESIKKPHLCEHLNIIRTIQCPRTLIKFSISQSDLYQISPILFSEQMMKSMLIKDQKFLAEIYKHEITEKSLVIEDLQNEMKKMPFSLSLTATFVSSISGVPPHEHVYFDYFVRIMNLLKAMSDKIAEIEASYLNYFSLVEHDWTITMRKFYKIEHVLKIILELIGFINHSLKKEKIEETGGFEENYVFTQSLERVIKPRKDSEQTEMLKMNSPQHYNSPITKFNSTQSMHSLMASMRKDTGGTELQEIDDIFKKSRRHRYPLYQGVYLYYPIGNINDPVSLLACCLNSDEFNEHLKEQTYRDFINCKMTFTKQLQTEWQPSQQSQKMYKELLKEEYPKNESYEYTFSIYYHRQFEELRLSEGVNFNLYIRSLYGCQNWDSSGGKSNSTFSKSHNEVLVVKIINEKEFVEFQKFAPAYLKYMKGKRDSNDQSYLAKIYGIYEATFRSKIYKFVVMQNIFLGMSGQMKVYDLKGSEVNRLATPQGEKAYTGLDTNFIIDKDGKPYILDDPIYDKTMKTFEEDAAFLRDQSVIDYSLLVIESEKILRMGIIDFMRPYHFIEKIETIYKEIKSGKDPTVIPPLQYAERFVLSLKKYFIKVPRSD